MNQVIDVWCQNLALSQALPQATQVKWSVFEIIPFQKPDSRKPYNEAKRYFVELRVNIGSSTLFIVNSSAMSTEILVFSSSAYFFLLQNLKSLAKEDPGEARARLRNVKGYLVQLPLHFLEKEDLRPPIGSQEYIVPGGVFTWMNDYRVDLNLTAFSSPP